MVPVKELRAMFSAENPNDHPEEQIDELVEQFRWQGVRHPVIVSLRTGKIVAGHGRVLAAEKAGLQEYPADFQAFASEAEEYSFLVADNSAASWSKLNLSKIHKTLPYIEPFDVNRLAIKNFRFEPNFAPGTEDEQGKLDEKKPVTCPSCGETFVAT